MRRVLLSAVIVAALAVPLARAEETCSDLLTDAAIDQALDQIKKESP
jgi:ABC-type transporter MlaC component